MLKSKPPETQSVTSPNRVGYDYGGKELELAAIVTGVLLEGEVWA